MATRIKVRTITNRDFANGVANKVIKAPVNSSTGIFVDTNEPVKTVEIKPGDTVQKILPGPGYTALYQRSVLSNTFQLSNLVQDSQVDLVLTRPPFTATHRKKKSEVAGLGEIDTALTSNLLSSRELILQSVSNVHSNTWEVNLEPDRFYSAFVPDDSSHSEPIRTFASAAAIGMAAIGPQDKYLYAPKTDWTPVTKQHTNFSIVKKELKVTTPPYIGNTLTVPINVKENGDLIKNMYFKCTLPPNVNYTDRVGVALIDKAELYFDSLLVDSYDSDWHSIYNDLFLSADEILGLVNMIGGILPAGSGIGPTTSSPVNELIVPLRFFFSTQKDLYLPLCAMGMQKVYVRLYFNPQSWFTDNAEPIELTNVSILYDQVFLTAEERMYYMNKPITLKIPKVFKEPDCPRSFGSTGGGSGTVNMQMNPNFRVTMINWFIRNKNKTYKTRYDYGYQSSLARTYTQYKNWLNQTLYYDPVIDYINIYINNKNITQNLREDSYFLFKHPIDHGLSVPDKNIYTYCFSDDPKKFQTATGDVDFRKIDSKTTSLNLKFKDSFVPQLSQSFELVLYYYGYTDLVFSNGYGSLLEI
jgi:hypothetical protein